MKKQIITILTILFSLTIVSALYAGESISFETELINPDFIVIGNSSDLTGMNISYGNGNITISTVQNFRPDNFTLVFFDKQTKEIEKIVHTGDSGGWSPRPTKYINITDINETKIIIEEINNSDNNSDNNITETILNNSMPTKTKILIGFIALIVLILIFGIIKIYRNN